MKKNKTQLKKGKKNLRREKERKIVDLIKEIIFLFKRQTKISTRRRLEKSIKLLRKIEIRF